MFSYMTSLGQADTGTFDNANQYTYLWILYIVEGILISIIMLNLLIAIISEAFGRINENIVLANY